MQTGFSNRMKDVFTYVREEVLRLGDKSIGIEHLLLGILRDGGGTAIIALNNLGIETTYLKDIIESSIPRINIEKKTHITVGKLGKFVFSKGIYIYTGSAKKNINHRLKRHLTRNKKLR